MIKPGSPYPYIVASVDRALELLLILGRNPQAMGVTELGKLLNVQKSTVHSLLQTLLAKGFVQQNEAGRYMLGLRLMHLGTLCSERIDIKMIARPLMIELAQQTQEIAMLAILSREELIIIEKVEPQRPFFIIPKFDFSITLHSTAMGKLLLANADESVQARVLERGIAQYTAYTITDRHVLEQELTKVRCQGFAMGCNETIEGITCIAVPVYNAGGEVTAALSVSSASSTMNEQKRKSILQILREKARSISEGQGYPAVD
ncbi:IclR family transcriptional regulator [Acetonema longum]|uniref:Glycerol operon regulatory protein n=1 Tax=Acetonema longum DSM 6540 TaxID=1009370 RepID=F7NPA6_9FIRM|nr:IclR family transcriptional regulator [Acetonema longum]EGO62068.1 IclR family transcriptional regulator [Acetonema longum DSM 6540]